MSDVQWSEPQLQFPVHSIISPRFNADAVEEIKSIMQLHGGRMEETEDECILHFPDGTRKDKKWLTAHNDKYIITFPDGFQLDEEITMQGKHLVMFPLNSFSPELQKRYR